MAKQPRVWSGSQWEPLAVTLPDLSNYSTTTQMNTAIDAADGEVTLSSGTVTAASTVNISNALSDTYKFYKLTINLKGSTNSSLMLRARENTTDKATAYYAGGVAGLYTGTTSIWGARNNGTEFIIGSQTASNSSSFDYTIFRPSATEMLISGNAWAEKDVRSVNYSGALTGMTNFNGISFYPDTGTITGYYILTGRKA